MSKWNRPMRKYKPEPVERSPKIPSVHPKVRARVLAAIPHGAECSFNDLKVYTGYEGTTIMRAVNVLELAGEVVGVYGPSLPYRWKRANTSEGDRR